MRTNVEQGVDRVVRAGATIARAPPGMLGSPQVAMNDTHTRNIERPKND